MSRETSSNELTLKKFNPNILEKKIKGGHCPTMVLLGRRHTGKSTICIDLLYNMQFLPCVIVFSATEFANSTFGKHVHNIFIYNTFEPDVLRKIMHRQKKKVKELTKLGEDPKKHPEISVCIILDDMNYDKRFTKDPIITEILLNGRHFMITLIATFQYLMSVPPLFRTNIDYVFACRETKADNLVKLYKFYFSDFNTLDDFKKTLTECTESYGCMVLDNTNAHSTKLNEKIYWYRAKTGLKFKINEANWPIFDTHLKHESSDEDEAPPPTNKKQSNLKIKKIEQTSDDE